MSGDAATAGPVAGAVLAGALKDAGWLRQGGRRDSYVRYAPPGHEHPCGCLWSVVIPLDPSAPDYRDLLDRAVEELRAHRLRDPLALLDGLLGGSRAASSN